MAPLSVLPGRLRFEAKCLISNGAGCDLLEKSLLSLRGVTEISSSHRTGRILIKFDEDVVSSAAVEEQLSEALRSAGQQKQQALQNMGSRRGSARGDASGVGHFVMEMALHAFLPAPLDLLLPAATALRK